MLNNGNKTSCEFTDDIVSYLYGEISATARTNFEDHLSDCSICLDEFAAISNARLSVFEWRRDEFADLPTPEIVIPYRNNKAAVEKIAPAGMLGAVRVWLSLVNFPVAAAAGLIVLLGMGLVAIGFFRSIEQPIASNGVGVPPVKTVKAPDTVAAPKSNQPEVAADVLPPTKVSPNREIRPTKVVEVRRSNSKKQLMANSVDRNVRRNNSPAPILSENDDENEDASLRLADLFADIDS